MSRNAALNIGTYLTRSAEQYPDRLAVACGSYRATFAEEEFRVNAFALALKDLGLEKGDRVAILQWNCPQYLETMLACFKAGFCIVPINARLHPEEIRYQIRDSEATAVVYGDEFGEAMAQMRESLPPNLHFISLRAVTAWELDFEGWVRLTEADIIRLDGRHDWSRFPTINEVMWKQR